MFRQFKRPRFKTTFWKGPPWHHSAFSAPTLSILRFLSPKVPPLPSKLAPSTTQNLSLSIISYHLRLRKQGSSSTGHNPTPLQPGTPALFPGPVRFSHPPALRIGFPTRHLCSLHTSVTLLNWPNRATIQASVPTVKISNTQNGTLLFALCCLHLNI